MAGSRLTIGRVAGLAGVNVETVRYYQRLGLIAEPARPQGGYRSYAPQAIDRIRFIKRAQQLGFSLREVSELLALGQDHCDDVRRYAEDKLAQIKRQIEDLRRLQASLEGLVRACGRGDEQARCPIVEALSGQRRSS